MLSTLELRLDNQWKLSKTSNIGLHGELNWQCQYGNLNRGIKLNFTDTASSFTTHSVPASRHGVALKVGTDINIKKILSYQLIIINFIKNYHDNNIDAKIAVTF
ncbi:autotransporter outer membrane beta-barrel domain-containing protein [Providencia rettgeri]|uniref:Autotransporter outer membrane beta-barrel domain-containing protein n=1 Tax=Providencia rettgeri TaxID=587 RepID=A0A939NAU0_PRORE|nr:autotransporter outer membrane beta-barrel domain-containing protein [Providencia rettgeri]